MSSISPLDYINLVRSIARKIKYKYMPLAELDELVSYGTIAMMESIPNFDPNRGVKFSTYASYRIFGGIISQYRREYMRRKRDNITFEPIDTVEEVFSTEPLLDENIYFQQIVNQLHNYLLGCTENKMSAVLLHMFGGLSQREAAARSSLSKDQVRCCYDAAIKHLRDFATNGD